LRFLVALGRLLRALVGSEAGAAKIEMHGSTDALNTFNARETAKPEQ
jgi:hypothetical protein